MRDYEIQVGAQGTAYLIQAYRIFCKRISSQNPRDQSEYLPQK